jgi:phosphate:Na+ symporter
MRDKRLHFSQQAMQEMAVLRQAIHEIMELAVDAFRYNDMGKAIYVEPLEQVIDTLKEEMRTRHIFRMKQETCSVEVGFVWSDLLTSLERVSDHCSNIAGCVIDIAQNNLNLHESLKRTQTNYVLYREAYQQYSQKYALPLSR